MSKYWKGRVMFKNGLFILGFIALALANASAQSVSLGPQIGFQRGQDADNGNVMVGAAMRMKLSPGLGLEGSVNYREQSYSNSAVTVREWPVMVTGLIAPIQIGKAVFPDHA